MNNATLSNKEKAILKLSKISAQFLGKDFLSAHIVSNIAIITVANEAAAKKTQKALSKGYNDATITEDTERDVKRTEDMTREEWRKTRKTAKYIKTGTWSLSYKIFEY